MIHSLQTKFLLLLLLGGALLALFGSWLSYQSTVEQLRTQLLQRAQTLGTAIDEATKIARNNVEIRFAVENIIKEETGIYGITVATKNPFVIWASTFHPEANRKLLTQRMLTYVKRSMNDGIFGYRIHENGDLEMLYPLSLRNANETSNASMSRSLIVNQIIDPALLESDADLTGHQILPASSYRGVIHLLFDWSKIQEASSGLLWFSVFTLLSGITIITLLAIVILYKTVLRPIDAISAVMQKQHEGDRTARMPNMAPDEIGKLGAEFNKMLDAMTESEEKFKSLAENTQDFIMRCDIKGRHLYANPAVIKLTGLKEKDVIGKTHRELNFDPALCEFWETNIPAVYNMAIPFKSIFKWKRNGEEITLDCRLYPEFDENYNIKTVLGISRDITEFKKQEEKILHQAHFDNLTGLPNRFLSLDRLSQQLIDAERKHEKVAVLFLDLDDFKKVNDTLGHETGDKLLIEAAGRLNKIVRGGDTVGRLGGDEFIVLLGGLESAVEARPVVENMINQFRQAFKIDGREMILTSSVGIAIFPDDGKNSSELLRNADSAMYHAKEKGRNTDSYYTDAMNREVSRRLAIEEQLYGALERNEFEVFYQPKIDLNNDKIIGAETLLRWHNAALGDISPTEFITITEQTGLIVQLGQFVLTEALKMTRQWHQSFDTDFFIAVNLSPRQFLDPELVNFIEKTIEQSGVGAKYLELEITEGMLMSGHSYIDDALTALNNMGVCIAMDDFGTGYSSLGYLRRYPFDVLKIDREFINDITVDQADLELVNATIVMAHALQIKVVAEGIETKEQFEYLKRLGCDFGQGYYFGRPVPAEQMTEWLKKSQMKPRSIYS
jgi:diguanylate cyclase (GGDEF)-like protein/PAS domain S-box-containing protein